MMTRDPPVKAKQRGLVLVSSLLLLLVVTLMALAIFRSFGVEEKIAGNQREKQRALHAAESAQQFAEWWLSSGTGTTTPIICNSVVVAAVGSTAGQVCANTLPAVAPNQNVANLPLPWTMGGATAGVAYAPPNMQFNSALPDFYSQSPMFYISYLGTTADSSTSNFKLLYQVDAVGYGANANTVAIVESTYFLTTGVCDLGAIGGCS